MSDLAYKTKSMSILNNLIETAQTTLVQARGLDKPHQPRVPYWTTLIHAWGIDKFITLLLVKLTTPDIRKTPSTWNNLLRH